MEDVIAVVNSQMMVVVAESELSRVAVGLHLIAVDHGGVGMGDGLNVEDLAAVECLTAR